MTEELCKTLNQLKQGVLNVRNRVFRDPLYSLGAEFHFADIDALICPVQQQIDLGPRL